MRLLTTILAVGLISLCLTATAQSPLDQLVSVEVEGRDIAVIFQQLEAQTGLPFYYQSADLPVGYLSLKKEDIPLSLFLSELLNPAELGFSLYKDQAIIIGPAEKLAGTYNRDLYLNQYQASITNADTLKESAMTLIGEAGKAEPDEVVLVRGTVLDRETDQALTKAVITLPGLNQVLQTDGVGEFVLRVKPGDYLIQITETSHEPLEQTLRVLSGGDIEFAMDVPFYRLEEVQMSARAEDANIRSVQPGIVQLSVREIREVPTFLGEADVVKSLLVQPGVSTVGEGASGFNVRGGNIDQNLIMQDGAMIFNSSHILGFFSIFNADAIEGLTLYKGHIPAQYGGRVASVLDVETKEGNYKKLKGEGGLGLVSARFLLDGPIKRDKTSFVAGVRSFYPLWVLPFFDNRPDLRQSSAFFVDGNFKVSHKFSPTNILSLSTYASYDFFRYSDEYGFDWSTLMGTLEWKNLFSPTWSSTTRLTAGNYNSGLFNPTGPSAFTLRTGIRDYRLQQQFLYAPNSQTSLRVGIEETYYQTLPQNLMPRGEESGIAERTIEGEQGLESAVYANLEFSASTFIAFSVGLRASAFQNLGPNTVFGYAADGPRQEDFIQDTILFDSFEPIQNFWGLEPRVSMRILVDETSSIKLSYGRHRQYVHLISNTSAATPVDLWTLSNRYLPPQISDNFSIGFFKNFNGNGWETGIDLYYRNLSSLIEYKDLPELLLNEHLETELLAGFGRAYGFELSLRKNIGRWQGDIAYTYARSLRRAEGEFPDEIINLGNWYPANFDSPHNLNLNVKWKARKSQLFSANFVYRSGRPTTAPIGDYVIGSVNIPHYSPRNLFRIPNYHRLDLAYTFKPALIKRKTLKSDFTISVYNLYFRKNPFSIFFRKSDTGIPETYQLAILGTVFPSFTWNYRF